MHLAKHMHDVTVRVTEIWCPAEDWTRNATERIGEATCLECLRAATQYGDEARRRRIALDNDRSLPGDPVPGCDGCERLEQQFDEATAALRQALADLDDLDSKEANRIRDMVSFIL